MFGSILDDIKREFNFGNMITRIIIVNVAVFVLINIIKIVLYAGNGGAVPEFYNTIVHFFCMSSDWWHVLTHPWVIFTSIFMHEHILHILFNMLFLYWFGAIVGDFIGNHRILPIYLLGGLAGGLVFFISAAFLPNVSAGFALGASAGVMAIVVAAGTLSPDYEMNLLLIGPVKLKYIVAVLVFIDLMGATGYSNSGGAFAHLGGALFGYAYVKSLRNGSDWTDPVNKILNRISLFWENLNKRIQGKPRKPRVVYKNVARTTGGRHQKPNHASDDDYMGHQEQLDAILEKIKDSGYDSLSKDEKKFLNDASQK